MLASRKRLAEKYLIQQGISPHDSSGCGHTLFNAVHSPPRLPQETLYLVSEMSCWGDMRIRVLTAHGVITGALDYLCGFGGASNGAAAL